MCRPLLVLLLIAGIISTILSSTVPTSDCPENEFYAECGANCQTECATLHQPCFINYIRCPSGCYCDKGFARNASGKCVRIEDCISNWSLFAGRNH